MTYEPNQDDCQPDDLDLRIQADRPPGPDDSLLDRCLATIPEPSVRVIRPYMRRRWGLAFSGVAAAVVALACLLTLPINDGSGNVLAEVYRAWQDAPVYRIVLQSYWRSDEGEMTPRTTETWFVRGLGLRTESRDGTERESVTVDNLRWEFRWSVAEDHVIAWPSKLAGPDPQPRSRFILLDRAEFLRWAERTKAEVASEKTELDGVEVEKVTLSWPGEVETGTVVVWFDPKTRRPLRMRSELEEGLVQDARIEYPAADDVPRELFQFEVPRTALLEINDPQLQRQLFSEGAKGPDLRK